MKQKKITHFFSHNRANEITGIRFQHMSIVCNNFRNNNNNMYSYIEHLCMNSCKGV